MTNNIYHLLGLINFLLFLDKSQFEIGSIISSVQSWFYRGAYKYVSIFFTSVFTLINGSKTIMSGNVVFSNISLKLTNVRGGEKYGGC
jgi:hypothetical protein